MGTFVCNFYITFGKTFKLRCNVDIRVSNTMTVTLSISGVTSNITTHYSPALQLEGQYECGLLYFSTFNSIPNIDDRNNLFHFSDNKVIKIPEGSYELHDINDYLTDNLKDHIFQLSCNNNTLQTSIFCSEDIHFDKNQSIGKVLGFGNVKLPANILHVSKYPVSILSTTVVRIECDIVSGSFVNGKSSHIIYEFAPNVPPGYRIIESPKNVIYFPVNQNNISSINIRILDINNHLVNLRGEESQLYLHLRKLK